MPEQHLITLLSSVAQPEKKSEADSEKSLATLVQKANEILTDNQNFANFNVPQKTEDSIEKNGKQQPTANSGMVKGAVNSSSDSLSSATKEKCETAVKKSVTLQKDVRTSQMSKKPVLGLR